jgi:hypothetical protein
MKNQDEIDTTPVVMKNDTRVTFESIELGPGERAEIVLSPDRPLRCPILFMSTTVKHSVVVIEQVMHGRAQIFDKENVTIEQLRFGRPTGLTVTESEPIKIIVANTGTTKTTVGASLVMNEQQQDLTYRLKGDEVVQDKDKE